MHTVAQAGDEIKPEFPRMLGDFITSDKPQVKPTKTIIYGLPLLHGATEHTSVRINQGQSFTTTEYTKTHC